MTIDAPSRAQYPMLKALWRQAFGDPESFVEAFFATGFSPERCRCLCVDGKVAAALYWFDCTAAGKKWAYIYAVATDISHRGKGLCPTLMEDTHRHLSAAGYAGAVLVPAKDHLWAYYEKLGYTAFGGVCKAEISGTDTPFAVERISPAAYRSARSAYLPAGGLCQVDALPFYETWGGLYQGEGILFAAAKEEETLYFQEFWGDPEKLPGAISALGAKTGHLRTCGGETPCGMYRKCRTEESAPTYLGFALD